MTRLAWNELGERKYEFGIDRGVLYTHDGRAVPWNGLISVNEQDTFTEPQKYYIDGRAYNRAQTQEEFAATLTAYTYPDEFEMYDGYAVTTRGLLVAHQPRNSFGLSYRTLLGNDLQGRNSGYKIHLVYNCLASPSGKPFNTESNILEPVNFSWAVSTIPETVTGYRPTAHLILDTRRVDRFMMRDLEDILYGTENTEPRLPSTEELMELMDSWVGLIIIDNGDGTFTATGPDEIVRILSEEDQLFEMSRESINLIDDYTYTASTF